MAMGISNIRNFQSDYPYRLFLGKHFDFLSVTYFMKKNGLDSKRFLSDVSEVYNEKITQIRENYPQATRTDFFLNVNSDSLYLGLYRELSGDSSDEKRLEPLYFYLMRCFEIREDRNAYSDEQLTEICNSINQLVRNAKFSNSVSGSFEEQIPFKLIKLGNIFEITLPFELEPLGISDETEELNLRLMNGEAASLKEYFCDELRSMEIEVSRAVKGK